jgi:hypothetical protein
MGTVLEPRLVGYWTDRYLYPGDMESADIAFRAEGNGWVYWCNAAKAFEILRFTWQSAPNHQVVLSIHEELTGTWDLDGQNVTHVPHAQAHRDEQITLAYTIGPGNNADGEPATLLSFDQPVIRGATGDQFTLERQLTDNERDPARGP